MTKKKKEYTIISANEWEESDLLVSLGNPILDQIVGGGIPLGRQIEFYGSWSTGKTVLTWTLLREAQKLGGKVFLVEAEHAFRKDFAEKCGLDLNKLSILISTKECPITIPIAFEAIEDQMKASRSEFFVAAVDSIAGLLSSPQAEDGIKSYSTVYVAPESREIGKCLRRIKAMIRPYNTILVFVNQVRDSISILYGDKKTTPGGSMIKYYSDIRLFLKKRAEDPKGILVQTHVEKNKLSPPFRKALVRIIDSGLDPSWGQEIVPKKTRSEFRDLEEENDALAIEEG